MNATNELIASQNFGHSETNVTNGELFTLLANTSDFLPSLLIRLDADLALWDDRPAPRC